MNNNELGASRWMKVKRVVMLLDKESFTVLDVANQMVGITTRQVATTLRHGVTNGFLEVAGEKPKPGGGAPLVLYSIVKRAEFSYNLPELGGIWKELTMRPYPIPKGRVHLCEAK